jgi:CxxC motif-containing protein
MKIEGVNKKNITCTICPMGCNIEIFYENCKITEIKGYTCKRGLDYGMAEGTNPVRMLTTTVKIKNGKVPLLPVKSEKPLPKNLIFESMKVLKHTTVSAPIAYGDIIVENILDTGINIIAVRELCSSL